MPNKISFFIFLLLLYYIISQELETFSLTNLSPGLFAISVSIGYPMHKFLLLLDTSSQYTWVRGKNCTFCSYAENIYDEEASISAIRQDDIAYTTSKDIKGTVAGNIILDDIKIGEYYATKVEVLIASEDEFLDLADGVLSFSLGSGVNENLLTKLYRSGSIKKKVFSVDIQDEMNGWISIGDIPDVVKNDKNNYSKCSIYTNNNRWNCHLTHILVGDEFNFYKALVINSVVNFSTGLKSIYVPLDQYDFFIEKYFKTFPNYDGTQCTLKKLAGSKQILCKKSYLNFKGPSMHFIINGFAYTVPFDDLFEDVYSDSYNRFKVFKIEFIDTNEWYFGTVFLRQHLVVFDGENKQVGFYGGNKRDFTKYTNEDYEKNCWYNSFIIVFFLGLILVPMAWTIHSKKREKDHLIDIAKYYKN